MRLRLDPFIIGLLIAAALGSVLPLNETAVDVLRIVTKIAIALLFFLYGLRLSAAETWAGLKNWRLHAAILLVTFVVFPLIGLVLREIGSADAPLLIGVLFLCALPSTIQSSVAATSIARGNTAGAVISASTSNLLSVIVTPVLVALLISGSTVGEFELGDAALGIALQLLLPFIVGQLSRTLVSKYLGEIESLYGFDRGSIVLIVFVAFAAGRQADVWSSVTTLQVLVVTAGCLIGFTAILGVCWASAQLFGLNRADRITVLFCGSQKSLATGLPIAGILFAPEIVPLIAIPLMIYHQFQTIAAALIANRLARKPPN